MNTTDISVIIPFISDQTKLGKFCSNLFSSSLNIELIICEYIDENAFADISEDIASKIKIFTPEDNYLSFCTALKMCEGEHIILSDVNVIFSKDALFSMLEKSTTSAVACNVGNIEKGISTKLFSENYLLDELGEKCIYANHLLRKSVIEENNIIPASTSAFSVMNFIADYYRYDDCFTMNDVLIYADSFVDVVPTPVDWKTLSEYGFVFSRTCKDSATMIFLKNVIITYSALDEEMRKENFKYVQECIGKFATSYSICSWIKSNFAVDIKLLLNNDCSFEEFNKEKIHATYKEICLPIMPDDIVSDFFSGKLGYDTLKRCIGAWMYFKFYRGQNGLKKKIGCKLCRKFLGGEFNA